MSSSSASPSLHLFIPGLGTDFTGIAEDSFPRLPALSRILSRSTRSTFSPVSSEEALLTLFDVPHTPTSLPVAPFRYLGHRGEKPEAWCLCIDPVHLRADTSGLVLFDSEQFPLSVEESEAFRNTLAPLLAEDGWTLGKGDDKHWYLTGSVDEPFTVPPLSCVSGKPVTQYLPEGEAGDSWKMRLNEAQMLLHAVPENMQRAANGQAEVNSVWIWGGGKLPPGSGKQYSFVYTNDALTQGLASWTESAVRNCLPVADILLNDIQGSRSVLVHLDQLSSPAIHQDFNHWRELLGELEQQWFLPMLEALKKGRLSSIELIPLNGFRYRLARMQAYRFWRRDRAFHQSLQQAGSRQCRNSNTLKR